MFIVYRFAIAEGRLPTSDLLLLFSGTHVIQHASWYDGHGKISNKSPFYMDIDERGHLNLKHSKITIILLYNDSVVDTLTKVLCLQQICSKSAASQQLTEF